MLHNEHHNNCPQIITFFLNNIFYFLKCHTFRLIHKHRNKYKKENSILHKIPTQLPMIEPAMLHVIRVFSVGRNYVQIHILFILK